MLTNDGAASAAREAVAIEKASRIARARPIEWLPSPVVADEKWKGAYVQYVFSGFFFVTDERNYANVLDPANLWLTIHESIGHPTELDRAMGYEANYAGISFEAPPEKMLGMLEYGPSIMNIQGDRAQHRGLSTIGWDDDGVKLDEFLIVKKGMFNDYQTTREQAPWLRWWYDKNGRPVRSHGCSYAQGWDNVQFQRMPNVSLLPGVKEQSLNDLVAATDRGILIQGDGSFDGKGQPPQVNAVSHGSPPARFKNVNVIDTGRKA